MKESNQPQPSEDSEALSPVQEKKRKISWSWIYIAATVIAIVIFGIYNDQTENVIKTLTALNIPYTVLAIVVLLVFFLFEAEILRIMMKSQKIVLSHTKSLMLAVIGIYYSAIVPGAAGGEPAQSAYLFRDKVPAGSSTAVLLMKFFSYQCAFEFCSAMSFIFMYGHLKQAAPAMIPFIILGLAVNGASVIFFLSLFYEPVLNFFIRAAKWIVSKFKFLSKRTRLLNSIDTFERDFHTATDGFGRKKGTIVLSILLSIPQFFAQMSIIYFIFLSFGYRGVNYFEIFAIQSLLQVTVSFVPTPGSSGAQEIGFSNLFHQYFTNDDRYAGVMVWRFFTFYLVVIAGAAVVVIDQMLRGQRESALLNKIKSRMPKK